MAFKNGSYVETSLVTATSGGTLTLVNSSATYQIFTGALAHTLVLPDATTMPVGRRFEVVNTSTNVITVQSTSFAVVGTVSAGESKIFRLSDNSTADGVFDVTVGGTGGGLSASEAAQASALKAKSFYATSKRVIYNNEVVGGNYWLTKSPLNNISSYNMGYVIGGYGYSVGGYNLQAGSTITANERYNDDIDIWTVKQPLSLGRNTAASFDLGGYGFIAAGSTNISYNVDTLRYDPVLDTFSSRANMTTGRNSPTGTSVDNYGYCIAGTPSAFVDTNTVERFNDTLNVWTFAAPSINTREYATASTLNGVIYTSPGFRYATGGENNVVEKYDSIKNSWATVSPVYPLSLQGCTTSALSGRFTVSGGHAAGTPVDNSYSWSETTVAWTARSPLPAVRRLAYGFDLNGVNSSVGGTAAGNTTSAVHYRYYPNAMIKTSILLNSNSVPTAISLPVLMNSISTNTQVQVRTNGYDWKNFMSGGSAIKTGENITFKFSPEGSAYMFGGRDTNVSERIDDDANAPRIVASTIDTNVYASTSFTINGRTFFASGFSGVSNTNNRYYDEVINTWVSKAPITTDSAANGSYDIDGFGYAATGMGPGGTTTNNNLRYNYALDSWSSQAVHPSAVYDPGSCALRGLGYVFSGTTSTNGSLAGLTSASYLYTPATNAWTSLGNIAPVASISLEYVPFGDYAISSAYFTTGNIVNNGTHRFNPYTNSYTALANSAANIGYTTGGRMGGNMFSMGGYNTSGGTFTPAVNRFNPNLNSWASRTSMSVGRYEGGSSATFTGSKLKYEVRVGVPADYTGLGGGVWITQSNLTTPRHNMNCFNLGKTVYSGGGNTTGGSFVALMEKFDFSTNTWIQTAPMSTIRYGHIGFTLNGTGYMGMGRPNGGGSPINSMEQYNPNTRSWANKNNMNITGAWPTGLAINGFGYRFGGYDGVSSFFNSASGYNSATDTWSAKSGTMPGSRSDMQHFTIANRAYLTGGQNGSPQSSTYYYNDANDSYTTLASLGTSRLDGFACGVNGKGLVASGYNGSYLSSVEEYNPDANLYQLKSNVINASYSNAGSELDGSLLKIGGLNASSNYVNPEYYSLAAKNAVMSAALTVTE